MTHIITCPHCGTKGAVGAMRLHQCDEVIQEPVETEWRDWGTNDICRRLAIHHAITAELDDADLQVRLAASICMPEPRLAMLRESLEDVAATLRGRGGPREALVMLGAHCQLWLEDIDRSAA